MSLEEHWNSNYMNDIRKKLLAGKKIPQCQVCTDQVLNLHTYRNYFTDTLFPHLINKIYDSTDEFGRTSMKPISYDYRINNLCNFKCRMCGEQLSSAWENEKRKFNMWNPESDKWMRPEFKKPVESFQKNVLEKELQEAVDNGTIEEIYWVGGEPLMWDIHWKIMKQLVDSGLSKNIIIRYNTNLSKISHKGIHLSDLLPHFKKVNICASIDAVGSIGEYIRTGISWKQWLFNFKELMPLIKQYGDDALVFDVTLTTPGLFSMKEMFDLVTQLNVKSYFKITYSFDSFVLMSPFSLPRDILDEILDELINYCSPRTTWKTQVFIDTFREMKNRPTFEEEYPSYDEGFKSGRHHLQKLEEIRTSSTSLDQIFKANAKVHAWWNK
jgi:hypothetical protein